MNRVFLSMLVLAAFPMDSRAEDKVVRLKVRPMPAPKPALKYLLLPEIREMSPGNPAQWYVRCFAEQRNFFFTKFSDTQRARYLAMSLTELRAEKIRGYGGYALTQADWAARLDALDWQVLERVQTDGMDMRQPELGPLQILGTALKVRFRTEVANGQLDEAVRTAKTMFAFARHLGENPTHAANQLGLSVANLAVDVLEEMVQEPDCPNLYWALTDLPSPLVDLRKGFQGDRSLMAKELRPIRDDAVMSEEELEKVVSRFSGVMNFGLIQTGQSPHGLRAGLMARAKDAEKVHAIRERMLEARRLALVNRKRDQKVMSYDFFNKVLDLNSALDLIRKMPPLQIVLLDEKQEFGTRTDERMKLLALTPWQIDRLGGDKLERDGSALFANLLPHVVEARRAQGRLEQRIAMLRYVEALRLHAAEHDGKLPEKLSAMAVPLPDDPFTGKPFAYEVKGGTASLRGGSPRHGGKNAACDVRYEVTFQK
jgi:hypothetical protein